MRFAAATLRATRSGGIARLVLLGLLVSVLSTAAPRAAAQGTPSPGGSSWSPGPDASGSPQIEGAIENPSPGLGISQNDVLAVTGWVVDMDQPDGSDISAVDVYDGDPSSGSDLGTSSRLSRPDVAQAQNNPQLAPNGFSVTILAGTLSVGQHTLTVVAQTTQDGTWDQQVTVTVATPPARAAGSFLYATHVAELGNASLAAAGGFAAMVAYVPWSDVEPQPGQYVFNETTASGQVLPNDLTNVVNAAQGAGLRLVMRVDGVPTWAGGSPSAADPAALQDYVTHLTQYAGNTLAGIEIFNEVNLPGEWGGPPDPAAYTTLLQAAYQGVKQANTNVQVFSAGVSQRTGGLGGSMEDVDWLNGIYNAGAQGYFDALGVHAYPGNYAPSTDPTTCTPLCFRDIELYRGVMAAHGDLSTPVYISEMGALLQAPYNLGEYQWMALPAAQQATILVGALHLATTYPWVIGASVFNLDYSLAPWIPPTDAEAWFSLLNPDRSPRPVYMAIQQARQDGQLP